MWVLCDNCVLPSNAKHVVLGDVLVGVEITISQESFILWVPDIIHTCAKHVLEKESKWHLSCQCAWCLGTEYMSAGEC